MHMTTTGKSSRLGRRPGQQGPRPQPSNRDWVEKSTTGKQEQVQDEHQPDLKNGKRLKMAREEITVGTWNVRTLWATGQLELLRKEMERYRYDILGLSEVRWPATGELNGGEVIWSGEEKDHIRGVGFLLNTRARAALLGYKPVNSRIIGARFSGQPLNLSVIQIYAPTSDSTEEDNEEFYEKLENTLKELHRKDIKVTTGDWNAKIGKDYKGWEDIMQRYGYGERNERGERLLEFAAKHGILICNTKFQQKDCRKYTWMAPDGKHTNMIDLILIGKRWKTSVKLCRTFRGADISLDHNLVLCNLKLKLKRIPRKQYEKKRNIEALENEKLRGEYEKEISKRIKEEKMEDLSIDMKVSALRKIMEQAVQASLPLEEQAKKKWITEKTSDLAKEKRKARLKVKESNKKLEEYKKLCNEVRTSTRKDKQDWLEKQCSDIEKYSGEHRSREVYKLVKNINRKWQPRQTAIKDKQGKILMDKEETQKRWTEYCRELYQDSDQENTVLLQELEKISPPLKDDKKDNILYEEVEKAIKQLKKNKSTGTD